LRYATISLHRFRDKSWLGAVEQDLAQEHGEGIPDALAKSGTTVNPNALVDRRPRSNSMTSAPKVDPASDAQPALSPTGTSNNHSVQFFDTQFQRQVRAHEYALNPFEEAAVAYLKGTVLDLGSGLGNLTLAAGRLGHAVLAVDASPVAVARINADARRERLSVEAIEADIAHWQFDRSFDTIVAVGLLMFFHRERALGLLRDIQHHVSPGGRVIVNVLVEGTTFMAMFDPNSYYLFRHDELASLFSGWTILLDRHDTFPAPDETQKMFVTIVAEKPI